MAITASRYIQISSAITAPMLPYGTLYFAMFRTYHAKPLVDSWDGSDRERWRLRA